MAAMEDAEKKIKYANMCAKADALIKQKKDSKGKIMDDEK